MKQFKYKTSFASNVRCIINEEKDKFLSRASLNSLRDIIPDDVKNQEDLLCVAFNAFTPNLANKNGDMVDSKMAVEIYKSFIHKAINSEHSRGNGAIGHIVSSAFSKFDINYANGAGSELLEAKAVKDIKEPFNVSLSGVLYRLYADKLIDYVEDSNDPNSEHFMDVSASWELMFDTYVLAIGSKYLEECEIITDEAKIEELSKYLLGHGGSGKTPDGKIISRLITGYVIPAGIGLTQTPAGEVKGIVTDSEKSKISIKSSKSSMICPECDEENEMDGKNLYNIDDEAEITCSKCNKKSMGKKWKSEANEHGKDAILNNNKDKFSVMPATKEELALLGKNLQKNENSNSQYKKTDVKVKNDNKLNKIMDIKSRKDITDETLKEANASQIISVLDAEIEKISDQFVKDKAKVDTELKASSDKLSDLQKKYDEGQSTLNKVQEDLQKLVKANADREQEEIFNTRMNYFDAEYDLSEEKIRNIVARKIKGADEKTYNEAKEEIELLLAAKKKSNKVFDKKSGKFVDKEEMDKTQKEVKDSKASVDTKEDIAQDVVDKAIDNGEKTKTTVAATTTITETQAEKWAKAFGEDGWEVDKKAFRR